MGTSMKNVNLVCSLALGACMGAALAQSTHGTLGTTPGNPQPQPLLYAINPVALAVSLPLGVNDTNIYATITRTDGKPLQLARFETSHPWVTVTVPSETKANAASATVRVHVVRDGAPRHFVEYIQAFATDSTNGPAATFLLNGQFIGELAAQPEVLIWDVTNQVSGASPPAESMLKTVVIHSTTDKLIQIMNPNCTYGGIHFDLVPVTEGKEYNLFARLDNIPVQPVDGTIYLDTSLGQRMEIPMFIRVSPPFATGRPPSPPRLSPRD